MKKLINYITEKINENLLKTGGNHKWEAFLMNSYGYAYDGELIRRYPTEYAKYTGQGGLILFTGLMATLTEDMLFVLLRRMASVFGVFWGCYFIWMIYCQ